MKSSIISDLENSFSILFTLKTSYNSPIFAFHEHFGTLAYLGEILRQSERLPLKINIKHIIQLDYQQHISSVE